MRVDVGYVFENCPFCQKHNHFQINTKSNLYNSFNGCCKGGDIINFIMEIENLSFGQAINHLGDRFNIDKTSISLESTSKREKEILYLISLYEEDRLKKEENRFFDFLKFMEYEEIFNKAITLIGTEELIQYIYNLKGMGIYE